MTSLFGKENWFQTVSALAVIGGLMLVYYELRQAHNIGYAQMASDAYVMISQERSALLGEEPLEALAKACAQQSLSEKEAWVLHYSFIQLVNHKERVKWVHDTAYPELDWKGGGAFVELFLTPTGRNWWTEIGVNAGFHPEVVEVGNRALEQMRDFDCKVIVEAIIPKAD